MKRGEISNVSSYEVWVDARFIAEQEEQAWWEKIFPKKYELRGDVHSWLFSVVREVRLVLVWFDKPLFDEDICEFFSEVRHFASFQECYDKMKKDPSVVELVTEDELIVRDYVTIWDRNRNRYGRRHQVWITNGRSYRKF